MVNAPAIAAFAASSNSSFRVCRQLAHGVIRRDLPARFGGGETAHRRLRCWCESGVIAQVFRHLAEDQAVGRSRGGLTTKTHAIVNARGKVMALSLMPEQRADITEAESLLDEVGPAALLPIRLMTLIHSSKNSKNGRSERLFLQRETDAIHGKSSSSFTKTQTSLNGSLPD